MYRQRRHLSRLGSLNGDVKLISVDMPYPRRGSEAFVGIVVPERFRTRWTLMRVPDRCGLEKALNAAGGCIDLCHYDSDKSWWGRVYAVSLLWEALKPGGLSVNFCRIETCMLRAKKIDGVVVRAIVYRLSNARLRTIRIAT